MRLVSLNVWGGKVFDPLMKFVTEQAAQTDIFCFQEVFHNEVGEAELTDTYHPNLFNELATRLPGHQGSFALYESGHSYSAPVDYALEFGVAIFIRKDWEITEQGTVWVTDRDKDEKSAFLDRNMQFATVQSPQGPFSICNLHGIWLENVGKIDAPIRLEQSRAVRAQMKRLAQPQILCGDFNLNPDTKSLRILEEGMRNLIREYQIPSTRNEFYKSDVSQFADYTIVSPEITKTGFAVPDLPISDHRPMILEFELD